MVLAELHRHLRVRRTRSPVAKEVRTPEIHLVRVRIPKKRSNSAQFSHPGRTLGSGVEPIPRFSGTGKVFHGASGQMPGADRTLPISLSMALGSDCCS